ncbi:nineteen complex-related protein 2-domain-containing protein [Fimicolochytrium jonesii]|uniref:nineteen complex-related protein 2-domain-containing protein n=1 Tax=Fimicolochytrium jonesii TaxID=1396493 RepID=UPI0022FDFB21|nr:nineteen complex-related protein 2-domain-containing protein [Fimicolochytrium jonesii]KAI8827202.1 nineteen complex-related protein 2-domain-containing protein [Fimicolochytrium jonesii]
MSFGSLRRTNAKALRKKIQVNDDDDDNVENTRGEEGVGEKEQAAVADDELERSTKAMSMNGGKKSSKSTKSKGKKFALSFGEDEEVGGGSEIDLRRLFEEYSSHGPKITQGDGDFTIKKSAASKRMAKAKLNRDLVPEREEHNSHSAVGDYSAESLREMRESQTTAPPRATQTSDLFSGAALPALGADAVIPDAAAIHAARTLREQKRAGAISGVNETNDSSETTSNFIALSSNSREVGQILTRESRLVNEDDEDEGPEAFEDYERDRLTFGSAAVKEEEERRKNEFEGNLIEAQEDDQEDEELERWEKEQIRKGKKRTTHNTAKVPTASQQPKLTKIPIVAPVIPLISVSARLAANLQELETAHAQHTNQLAMTESELTKSASKATALESDLKQSSDRYDYFNDLRTYIGDLAEFLDAKFPELESLEKEYSKLLSARTRLAHERRQITQDHWFSSFMNWHAPPPEPMETDNDSESSETLTEDEMHEIKARVEEGKSRMFEDVGHEFRSLRMIKQKFETWKAKYAKEYDEAYGALSIPGIVELFVRHEFLAWDLSKSSPGFEDMQWHHTLHDYGISTNDMHDGSNPDTDVLSRIVAKVIIPRLQLAVRTYDPYSDEETSALLLAVNQCLDYVETSNEAFKGLLATIEKRFQDVTTRICDRYNFFTATQRPVTQEAIESKTHWYWTSYKLFANMMRWTRLSRMFFQSLVVDLMLNRQLVPILRSSLEVDTLVKIEKISQLMPTSWLIDEMGMATRPKFLNYFDAAIAYFTKQYQQSQTPIE